LESFVFCLTLNNTGVVLKTLFRRQEMAYHEIREIKHSLETYEYVIISRNGKKLKIPVFVSGSKKVVQEIRRRTFGA
jgi:hypothetical protein